MSGQIFTPWAAAAWAGADELLEDGADDEEEEEDSNGLKLLEDDRELRLDELELGGEGGAGCAFKT